MERSRAKQRRMPAVFSTALGALLLLSAPSALVAAAPPSPVPAAHCLDTTVSAVETYFAHDPASGWDVSFNGRIWDPYVGTLQPHLTDRGGTDYSVIHAGDRVHVCLVDYPKPGDPRCHPKVDTRGRVYSVWDARLRRTFSAPNSGHLCGGA